jgi:hypothetical protein
MRTVTFSNADVAESVNTNFVAAWFNRDPEFKNTDTRAEDQIHKVAMEGFATKNICTFFLTPGGNVLHYVAGYVSPEIFLQELDVALKIRGEALDDTFRLKGDGLDVLKRIHAERARHFATLLADVEDHVRTFPSIVYRDKPHEHTDRCAGTLKATFTYMQRLHASWGAVQELPRLDAVRFAYRYGNDFAEETGKATRIKPQER